jgi:hypothetical protein
MSDIDLSKLSNQERIELLGVEEASKYHGPYSRVKPPNPYYPILTPQGAEFKSFQEAQRKLGVKPDPMPREFIFPSISFKKNRPSEKAETIMLTRDKIKCSNSRKKRLKNAPND